jgi:hypothetical protein
MGFPFLQRLALIGLCSYLANKKPFTEIFNEFCVKPLVG